MKRWCLLLVVSASCLASAGWGADLTLPKTVTGEPGAFIQVPATTDGKIVKWYAIDPGLNLFPTDLLKDTKTAVVTSPNAGSYRLLAYTDGPSDPAVCTVVVRTPSPLPPLPGPSDDFTKAIQVAYAAETDPQKAKQVAWLASIYQGASTLLTPGMTAGTLFKSLSAAIHNPTLGIPAGSLPRVSRVIGDDLGSVLGTSATAPVDPAKAQAAFARYAAALGGLK